MGATVVSIVVAQYHLQAMQVAVSVEQEVLVGLLAKWGNLPVEDSQHLLQMMS
jgi:hypothetical protein